VVVELKQALEGRKSCRAFSSSPVERELVAELLRRAGRAPSALNLQPWEVTVVMGEEVKRLARRISAAHMERRAGCSPGARRPIPEAHQKRRRETFLPLAATLEKMGLDMERFVGEGSCRFYDAPVALVLYMDSSYSMERYLCLGVFVGYLLLAAQDLGLSTCPVGLVASYGEEIKDQLNIPEEKEVVLGIALGYPEQGSPLSSFSTPREPLESFVRWYG
jgi:nitroreductase